MMKKKLFLMKQGVNIFMIAAIVSGGPVGVIPVFATESIGTQEVLNKEKSDTKTISQGTEDSSSKSSNFQPNYVGHNWIVLDWNTDLADWINGYARTTNGFDYDLNTRGSAIRSASTPRAVQFYDYVGGFVGDAKYNGNLSWNISIAPYRGSGFQMSVPVIAGRTYRNNTPVVDADIRTGLAPDLATNFESAQTIKATGSAIPYYATSNAGAPDYRGRTFNIAANVGMEYASEWTAIDSLFTSMEHKELAADIGVSKFVEVKAMVDEITDNSDKNEMDELIATAE
ncbi:hypothetical protein, partial [Enterococcus faecium]|uniref:hypothetical protein n=1 Tax=Enterococcus faecium TaxID=1352 RepID=UPI0023B31586